MTTQRLTIRECIERMQNGTLTPEQAATGLGEFSYAVGNYSPARGEWDQYRAIVDAHAKLFAKKQVARCETELVACDCGHSVHRKLIMAASTGTSCPDCYDVAIAGR
jgi:hypothetical protein